MTLESETAVVGKHRVYVNRESYDPKIVEHLMKGSYESGERNVIPHVFKPTDRILEVGGAIGAVTMAAADIVGQSNIVAFEANPALIEDAKRNFAMNGVNLRFENVVLKNRISWGGEGEFADFHIHKEYWASSLVKIPGTIKTVQVPTKCFETEARNFGANALICDIEGGEIELLEMADLTGFDKILMEIHYWAGREKINRLMRKLIFDGFSVNFDHSFRSIVTLHRGLAPAV